MRSERRTSLFSFLFPLYFHIDLLARLGGKHEGGGERHVDLGKSRVRALDRPGPEPGDDRELLAHVRLQVRPGGRAALAPSDHLGRHLDLGVEVPDALLGLVPHPLAVIAHVLGQALGAFPLAVDQVLLASRAPLTLPSPPGGEGSIVRVHRRLARELGRDLDHRLIDQHRHRVEIRCVGLQPQPLGLQGKRPAAGKGVVEGRQLVTVEELLCPRMAGVLRARVPPALPDLVPGGLQDRLVGGVLPLHQVLDDAEEPLSLLLLLFFRGKEIRMRGRVIDHLGKYHGPCRRQRPPGPPQVQRARMPVPDGLLPRAGLVDRVQRQGDFDEFLLVHSV